MKSVLKLTCLAVIAGCVLALVDLGTRSPIARNDANLEVERLEGLLDDLDSDVLCEMGIVLVTHETRGYGGLLKIVTAMKDQELLGIRVTLHSETPGFAEVLRPDDWVGKFGNVSLDGIDAVTRATVTTNAVLRGVREIVSQSPYPSDEC